MLIQKVIIINTGCGIVVKKYRFDYILIKLSEDNSTIRVICYIDDFEIESGVKPALDVLPANINNDENVKLKLLSIMNMYAKVSIKLSSLLLNLLLVRSSLKLKTL